MVIEMRNTIKENRDFLYAYRKGEKAVTPYFVFYAVRNNQDLNRLGITVSKSVGKAHDRNRAKRLVREAYRQSISGEITPGYNIVVVAREKIGSAPFEKLTGAMRYCAAETGLIEKTGKTTDTEDGRA